MGQRARHVGTPQSINTFTTALNNFPTDLPGWPQFVRKYAMGSPAMETLRRFKSEVQQCRFYTSQNRRSPSNLSRPQWMYPGRKKPPLRSTAVGIPGRGSAISRHAAATTFRVRGKHCRFIAELAALVPSGLGGGSNMSISQGTVA